jgi:hypothetical protein
MARLRRRERVTYSREDAARLNQRFALLDRRERRFILRAVNRGEALPDRAAAELAVGVARRQQRFWSRAWLLGPLIAVVQVALTPITPQGGVLLALWGTLLLGGLAAWWWSRAVRAEQRNLLLVRRSRQDAWDGRRPGSGSATGNAGGRTVVPARAPRPGPLGWWDRRRGRSGASIGTASTSQRPRNRLPGGPPLPELAGQEEHDGSASGSVRPPRPRGRKRR